MEGRQFKGKEHNVLFFAGQTELWRIGYDENVIYVYKFDGARGIVDA
jgi:hypothetical protein